MPSRSRKDVEGFLACGAHVAVLGAFGGHAVPDAYYLEDIDLDTHAATVTMRTKGGARSRGGRAIMEEGRGSPRKLRRNSRRSGTKRAT